MDAAHPDFPAPVFTVLEDLLAWHRQHRPAAVAVRFEGRDFDYARLARRTERAAARLWHEWGVRPGDRVAWLGLSHVDQLTLLLALGRIGAVLVPLNFRLALPEWEAVLADCQPRHLLHDGAWADAADCLARAAGVPSHPVERLIATHAPGDAPRAGGPHAPALIVYTSGTTGRPKGAVHTQANLLANMRAAVQAQQLTPADTVLTVLPLFHVGGLCIQTLPALMAGACVWLHPRFEPGATLAAMGSGACTLTLQVPATMKALVEHPQWPATDLSGLRAVWAGSSQLPDALVDAFLARGLPLCNVYGATETGPFSIALPPDRAASHRGACGWPAEGVEVRLDQPVDGVGEVWLRGPAIVTRYWPDVPARDADGWFHSGDLARQAPDGSYAIVGRAKDMIISGGENIYPAEIEHLLAAHPRVAECAVVGLPDPQWGEVVAAVVVLNGENGLSPAPAGHSMLSETEQLLRDWLAPRLARYKLPRRWLAVEGLPRTALGKVQKAALLRQLRASSGT